jgi:hypothetical protein
MPRYFHYSIIKTQFRSLFLEEQVHVVDPQGCEFLVRAFQIKQQSAEGNKDGPTQRKIRSQHTEDDFHSALTHMFPEVDPSSNR